MHKSKPASMDRRRALALLGGGAAAVSVLGLSGCGGGEDAPRPELIKPEPEGKVSEPQPQDEASAPEQSAESMRDNAQEAQASGGDTIASDSGAMPHVDANSAKAQQLAYVHDASTVSPDKQPRYQAGQHCANCALYQGGDAEWGACPLFNGKQVKRTGWCNAYAARSA